MDVVDDLLTIRRESGTARNDVPDFHWGASRGRPQPQRRGIASARDASDEVFQAGRGYVPNHGVRKGTHNLLRLCAVGGGLHQVVVVACPLYIKNTDSVRRRPHLVV